MGGNSANGGYAKVEEWVFQEKERKQEQEKENKNGKRQTGSQE